MPCFFPRTRSAFQVSEGGFGRTARGTELRLRGGAELLPQVVEAVVQGVRELPCGLTVQLLWLPLLEPPQQQQGVAGGQQQGGGGQQAKGKGSAVDGAGPRGIGEAAKAAGLCKVPVLLVRL